MTGDSTDHWPRADEQLIVLEMLADFNSPHWEKCRRFVAGCLRSAGVPPEHQDDVIQEVMISVMRGLPNYRGDGLRTWLRRIARNRAIDWFRETGHLPGDGAGLSEKSVPEDEDSAPASPTPEEEFLRHEEVREALALAQEYASQHENQERTIFILQRHYGGHHQNETAELLGLSPARVSQIIQESQRYARKRAGRKLEEKRPAPRNRPSKS